MEHNVQIKGRVSDLPFVNGGISGLIFGLSDLAVIKSPRGSEDSRRDLTIERHVYQRLGVHPRIPRLLAIHNGALVLERLQHQLSTRLRDLHQAGRPPSSNQIMRWAIQIAQGLKHLHLCDVLQVDIGLHNVLLDSADNAKLCDFAGSSIDGSTPTVYPSLRSEHPHLPSENPTVRSELFALGSALYELETNLQPYHDREDDEVESLYVKEVFPNTDALLLGEVIMKCWKRKYRDVEQTLEDLIHIQENLKHGTNVKQWWPTK